MQIYPMLRRLKYFKRHTLPNLSAEYLSGYLRFKRLRNSSLVLALDRMQPSIQLVIVVAVVFSTPLMTIHKWLDSMTTATPWGFKTSEIASATCFVRRSWTCNRRENISARRANLESPRTRPMMHQYKHIVSLFPTTYDSECIQCASAMRVSISHLPRGEKTTKAYLASKGDHVMLTK